MREATAISTRRTPGVTWWKRIGLAGFLFFLAKGLLWLAVPYVLYLVN